MELFVKYYSNLGYFFLGIYQIGIFNTFKIFLSKYLLKNKNFKIKKDDFIFYLRHSEDASVFIEHILKTYYSFNFISNKKDFIMIDCGAFNGIESFRISKLFDLFNKRLRIYCVEANKENYTYLEKNLKNKNNIHLLNKAVYHTSNLSLYETKGELAQGNFYSKEAYGDEIKTISINDIILQNNLNFIDIVKIDIEGLEKELFSKNTEWLDKINCLIIEYHHLNMVDDLYLLFKLFHKKQFSYVQYKENIIIFKTNGDFSINIRRGIK